MELIRARLILEKTSPLPFIGFFVTERADRLIELSLSHYIYVIIDLEREHYSLAGRVDGQSFLFDSTNLQKRPICSLYVILLSWLSLRPLLAHSLFARLSDKRITTNNRNVADLLIFDTVQHILKKLECL